MRTMETIERIANETGQRLTPATLKSYVVNLKLEFNRTRRPHDKSVLVIDYPEHTVRALIDHVREHGLQNKLEAGEVKETDEYVAEIERRKDILCRWFRRRQIRRGESYDGPRMSSKPAVGHGVRRKHKKLA